MKFIIKYFLVFLLLISISLFSKIRHIYISDGAQAIQDSIDISEVYDTIMVHNGKYYIGDLSGNLGLNLKGRQLMSVSPDSAPSCTLTAISSSGLDTAYHVIWDTLGSVMGWHSLIQGFTIIDGNGYYGIFRDTLGGVYIKNWDNFSFFIQDNIIIKNKVGVFIRWSNNSVVLRRNLIINNIGSGIIGWSAILAIKNNIIKGNKNYEDGYGGGIFIESGLASTFLKNIKSQKEYTSIIENNLIINNYTVYYGGGVCCGYAVDVNLSGNTIAYNVSGEEGGGVYCGSDWSSTTGENNIFVANIANTGGAIEAYGPSVSFTNNFAVDNASYNHTSGLLDAPYSYSLDINYSNLYYNTYQEDVEAFINSSTSLENNFWWVTDSAKIDSLIDGPADFIPFMMGPVPDAPGEPVEIYSVLNYSSDYLSIIDSIGGDPDTLYLEITGHDNKHEFQEAAVAILKSRIYPAGIAVALLETDKSTGVYRGKAIVKTTNPPDSIRIDDIYQIIRVHPVADTIRVYANMDTTEMFKVYYRCQSGVEEESLNEFILEPVQSLTSLNSEFRFYLPEGCEVELSIYDICGRLVDEVLLTKLSSGWHTIEWEIEKAGVYIYQIKTGFEDRSGKIVVVR